MPSNAVRVLIVVDAEDDDERETLTAQLRQRLLELDVDDVVPAQGTAGPAGAKAGGAAELGAVVVTAAPLVLDAVVRTVEAWLTSRSARSVRLTVGDDEIELDGVSPQIQRQLADAFVTRIRERETPADGSRAGA
ncbi:effector-associated constant component EACC1 [Pseudofrankia inefficax]|uniref:Uncharacterized protein n=1 Tax=Pseudofrankia inefficax (strain DSM 45817 / CECT 9037 / DDB 130130 / EuI1c) TaxID=298654 RepID=E3J2Z4_PSEI1|nr:hypothetical protein [Pseudofrankia inefficax]ADP82944.1 hypothetical protein FraEuI1c_4955 [Pseudofrankia inefficax]